MWVEQRIRKKNCTPIVIPLITFATIENFRVNWAVWPCFIPHFLTKLVKSSCELSVIEFSYQSHIVKNFSTWLKKSKNMWWYHTIFLNEVLVVWIHSIPNFGAIEHVLENFQSDCLIRIDLRADLFSRNLAAWNLKFFPRIYFLAPLLK